MRPAAPNRRGSNVAFPWRHEFLTPDAARTSGGTHLEAISGLGMRIEHGLLGQTQLLVDTARPITWTIGNGR